MTHFVHSAELQLLHLNHILLCSLLLSPASRLLDLSLSILLFPLSVDFRFPKQLRDFQALEGAFGK